MKLPPGYPAFIVQEDAQQETDGGKTWVIFKNCYILHVLISTFQVIYAHWWNSGMTLMGNKSLPDWI